MTYRVLTPWVPLEELLLKPLASRVAYVRMNLAPVQPAAGRRTAHLTLDEFAEATGAKNRHRPIGWESGQTPRDYAEAIAALTPYPAAALGGPGEEELFEVTLGGLLQELRAEADRNRQVLEAILTGLKEAGIEIRVPRAKPRFSATAPPASLAGTEAR